MAETLEQINIRASAEDLAAIDALAKADGYANRSPWIRFVLRKIINTRRAEIVEISTLPRPDGAQVVPDISIQVRS